MALFTGILLLSLHASAQSGEEWVRKFQETYQEGTPNNASRKCFRHLLKNHPERLQEIADELETIYQTAENIRHSRDTLDLIYSTILAHNPVDPGKWWARKAFLAYGDPTVSTSEKEVILANCHVQMGTKMPLALVDFWTDLHFEQRETAPEKWVLFFAKMDHYLLNRASMGGNEASEVSGLRMRMHRKFRSTAPTCEEIVAQYRPAVMAQTLEGPSAQALLALLVNVDCKEMVLFEYAEAKACTPESGAVWHRLAGLGRLNMEHYDLFAGHLEEAQMQETIPEVRGIYWMQISQAHQARQDYPAAKLALEKAIELHPSCGDAYLQMADLLVEGAKKCPFNEFDSRAVYWAAIDYCQMAINRDQTVEEAAGRRLFFYQNQVPDKEMVTFKGFKAGDTYPLRCWMNLVTTVKVY